MDKVLKVLDFLHINSIFDILTIIGFTYFIVKRFILRKPPVPSAAFDKVPKELFQKCVNLLNKYEKKSYDAYLVPEDILGALQKNLGDEVYLKKLLCSICEQYGIDGSFIKLVVQDTTVTEKAGEIKTDLAFTTICLELKPYYGIDTVAAILAHEATHLHLYYTGMKLNDVWENEILTDTAAVYCGFGEYIYRGYAVLQGDFALSYQKVGYIRQEDVRYIQHLMESEVL